MRVLVVRKTPLPVLLIRECSRWLRKPFSQVIRCFPESLRIVMSGRERAGLALAAVDKLL